MADNFTKAVEDGMKLSKQIYLGKDRVVAPPHMAAMEKSQSYLSAFYPRSSPIDGQDFVKAIKDGMKLSKWIYFGKDRAVPPPRMAAMEKSQSHLMSTPRRFRKITVVEAVATNEEMRKRRRGRGEVAVEADGGGKGAAAAAEGGGGGRGWFAVAGGGLMESKIFLPKRCHFGPKRYRFGWLCEVVVSECRVPSILD